MAALFYAVLLGIVIIQSVILHLLNVVRKGQGYRGAALILALVLAAYFGAGLVFGDLRTQSGTYFYNNDCANTPFWSGERFEISACRGKVVITKEKS